MDEDRRKKRPTVARKSLTCDHCNRPFARLEHLQRHLRTHTKEKPFSCDICLKAFARSDLLVRHERLVHPAEVAARGDRRTSQARQRIQPRPQPIQPQGQVIDPQLNPSWGYDLNLLSHAASHVALEGQTHLHVQQPKPYAPPIAENYGVEPSILDLADLTDPVQDFTTFLESVGLSSDWDSGLFEPTNLIVSAPTAATTTTTPHTNSNVHNTTNNATANTNIEDAPSFSNFGSRLPSLQPEGQDSDAEQTRPAWDISTHEHQLFSARLEDFSHFLPTGFVRPSRHALSRYLAGYISGLNEHLPFIHVPTLSIARCPPELTLALAAAGSHYRFENSRGIELFHAAKAILLERLRRRDGAHASLPLPGEDGESQMEIIRTFLLLTIFASWESHSDILREMLALQSTLARLVRDHGLTELVATSSNPPETWADWSRQEADRRTKLVVYCFFNLHSIMYNIPPLILNSELNLNMPCSADEWKATSAHQWRRHHRPPSSTFQEVLTKLFKRNNASSTPDMPLVVSPLGNYVLIHAIIQQIFFARQLCLSAPSSPTPTTSLRPDDLTAMGSSLTAWKRGWRQTPESSIDPQNPAGPIAFTSTALLGLAYIRLHLDLGPHRRIVSQDPVQIAHALHSSPPLIRGPHLIMALLHSAHALSIPVRLGIDFVARTHSFFWSIQHSICSLECAFLLSRWLLAIPTQREQGLSDHERKLLLWVKGMMDETDMGASIGAVGEADLVANMGLMRQLSVAVVRVWSRTFKGNTSWPIVDLIGASLEIYANLLDT